MHADVGRIYRVYGYVRAADLDVICRCSAMVQADYVLEMITYIPWAGSTRVAPDSCIYADRAQP